MNYLSTLIKLIGLPITLSFNKHFNQWSATSTTLLGTTTVNDENLECALHGLICSLLEKPELIPSSFEDETGKEIKMVGFTITVDNQPFEVDNLFMFMLTLWVANIKKEPWYIKVLDRELVITFPHLCTQINSL